MTPRARKDARNKRRREKRAEARRKMHGGEKCPPLPTTHTACESGITRLDWNPSGGFKLHADPKTARFLAGTDTESDRLELENDAGFRRGLAQSDSDAVRIVEVLIASGLVTREQVETARGLVEGSR